MATFLLVVVAPAAGASTESLVGFRDSGYSGGVIRTNPIPTTCASGNEGWRFEYIDKVWATSPGNQLSSIYLSSPGRTNCNYIAVTSQDGPTWGKCVRRGDPGISWFGQGYNDHIWYVRVKTAAWCVSYG